MTALHALVRPAAVEAVLEYLARDPKAVGERNELGWTPLHLVVALGDDTKPEHAAIAVTLLEAGADVNARDIAGQTPLHLAAVNGSDASGDVTRVLPAYGADVNAEAMRAWIAQHTCSAAT